jgi:thiosulfate/3-mercaptopyruvate sulfurtransferase
MSESDYKTIVSAAALSAAPAHWVIVDCRHNLADSQAGRNAYIQGHIPGAYFLHLDHDLAGPVNGKNGRHPLPDPAEFEKKLMAIGIGPETQVVAYDDAGGAYAARLWWLLRWLGHEAVAVLDGGFPQWLAGGYPIEVGSRQPLSSSGAVFSTLSHPNENSWVPVEVVMENVQTNKYMLVDARSPDRFRGENETIDPVGGHIPGALNRFFRLNLNEEGRFKSADQLKTEWSELLQGRAPSEIIAQCGSGVTACHNLLALEMAGLQGARLYPGSWSEWCAEPSRPIASGS